MSDTPDGSPVEKIQNQALESQITEAMRTIYDPEIPVNIYEMGLIYKIDVQPEGKVHVTMTLTSPACPVAGALVAEVESKTRSIDGVEEVNVELVWEPTWTPELMSESAKLELNML